MLTVIKWLVSISLISALILFISLRSPWIEWDDENILIHGKVIKFDVSMSYVPLEDGHLKAGYVKEQIEIGRLLLPTNSYFIKELVYMVPENRSEQLSINMNYTIVGTFWKKKNWLSRVFSSDSKYALLKDSNDIYSFVSFLDFHNSTEKKLSNSWFINENE